jgi:hypothetical protein
VRFTQRIYRYHKVLGKVFRELRKATASGISRTCGDGVCRLVIPGILAASLDGEEACKFCACRALGADFPCSKCLVPHDKLDELTIHYKSCTTDTMRKCYEQAQETTSHPAKERILRASGLHDIKVCCYLISSTTHILTTATHRILAGRSASLTRTKLVHTMYCITMTWANLENTCGPTCSSTSRIMDLLTSLPFRAILVFRLPFTATNRTQDAKLSIMEDPPPLQQCC